MAPVPGIVLGGAAVPTDSADTYPVTDPQWGLGGAQFKTTTANRNAITVPRLQKGMLVFCEDTGITYRLKNSWAGGITTDADWEPAVGSSGGITGAGNPTSIALWNTATDLSANVFFTRSNTTSVVYNNTGYTADYDVDVERYIDPAGSNSNAGTSAGPSNAWQTPAYAVQQCQQMGPGRYIIHCAAGTYSSVTVDVPDVISRGMDASSLRSLIEFEGDQVTPGNVIFSNTSGTLFYQTSRTTTLRLHGITFQGNVLNNGTAISQNTGMIIFRNCVFNNFFIAHRGDAFCSVIVEAPTTLTDCYYGFSGSGTSLLAQENITHTAPDPATQPPSTFSFSDGQIIFGLGKTYSLTCPVGSQTGQLISARSSYIQWGTLNSFISNDAECLFDLDWCGSLTGTTNGFFANEALSYCKLRNCVFANSATDAWWATNFATEGVKLYGQAVFVSDIVLALGTPPIGSLQDYMTTYVQFQPNVTYTVYGLDNRFVENYTFTCLGELPQGYTLADLGPQGFGTAPYYLFTAPYDCQIVEIRVSTRVGNGGGHTDQYIVGVNGASSGLSVSLTNSSSGSASSPVVDLTTGDQVSIRLNTDAATTAEDVTVQISVRRYS